MKFVEFRMHCGLADGLAGSLRVMSTAERANLVKMDQYMSDLMNSVKRMREILDEEINIHLASRQV